MAIALAPAAAEVAAPVAAEAAGSGAATQAAGGAAASKAPKRPRGGSKTEFGDIIPNKPTKKPTAGMDTIGSGGSKEKKSEPSKQSSSSPSRTSKISKSVVGRIANKKMLLPELIACLVVLVFGTLVAPKGSKDDVHRLVVKGSALMAVFFILAIFSTGGKGAQNIANTLGLLITLAYLLNSSDIHNVLNWTNSFFKKPQGPEAPPETFDTTA